MKILCIYINSYIHIKNKWTTIDNKNDVFMLRTNHSENILHDIKIHVIPKYY